MPTHRQITRVAVLWEHVTGYVQAALQGLLDTGQVHVLTVQRSTESNARFDRPAQANYQFIELNDPASHSTAWLDRLLHFAPDIALITGVRDPRYLEAARRIRQQGGLVIWASDRIRRSVVKDTYQAWLGRARHVWGDYAGAFVPGYKAAEYAQYIGFSAGHIFPGLYTCDTAVYRPIGLRRHGAVDNPHWPRVFLFVGQFIRRKGLDRLLEAYAYYRQHSHSPWELWCAGAGPLRKSLEGQDGVRILDFLSPQTCAQTMGQVGALILPSRWDHWGVVVHEATCAGLPVIVSRECGAAVELVQDGFNGFTFPAEDSSALIDRLIACADENKARELGANSLRLSYRFDPQIFASLVLEHIPRSLVKPIHVR